MEETINKAFQLAYFIHGERPVALSIAAEAAGKLEVASAAQHKRLYYVPAGRPLLRPARTKVTLSDLHLLQRLVYIASEPYEIQQERSPRRASLDEEDMIIRFVKHLVKITVRRNSFYVTLGISRLLYNYSTAEAVEIYNVVVQDPDRVKDDYYFRSRKGHLLRDLKERFGDLLNVVRGQRGEERFQVVERPERRAPLVEECLRAFTPWDTRCVVTATIDPLADAVPGLAFGGDDPDAEHRFELNRFHTLLHPDCFGRLLKSMRFASPAQRLAVPHFSLSEDQGGSKGPPPKRRPAPELSTEELNGILGGLSEQAARRKAFAAGLLRVMVDGVERARLDPRRAGRVQFAVEEGAELLEVRAVEERQELLLATHLLSFELPPGLPRKSSVVLEGGQELSFIITLSPDAVGHVLVARVAVSYRETSPVRAASLFLRRLRLKTAEAFKRPGFPGLLAPKPALAFALVALCAMGLALYLYLPRPADPPLTTAGRGEVAPAPTTVAPQPPSTTGATPYPRTNEANNRLPARPEQPALVSARDGRRVASREGNEGPIKSSPASRTRGHVREPSPVLPREEVARRPAAGETTPADDSAIEATRALPAGRDAATLLTARKIYLDVTGERLPSRSVREALTGGLQAGGEFAVAQNPDEADAVFRISVRRESAGAAAAGARAEKVAIVARLVNAKGDVIWPSARADWRAAGEAKGLVERMVRAVLGAKRNLERRR